MTVKYLVDTHILLWAFSRPSKISKEIRKVLEDESTQVYFSPISLWEIAIKYGLGKLSIEGVTPEEFYRELKGSFFLCLPLSNESLVSSYRLPKHHKDPFDRMLFWEAIRNDFVVLSADTIADNYKESGLHVIR